MSFRTAEYATDMELDDTPLGVVVAGEEFSNTNIAINDNDEDMMIVDGSETTATGMSILDCLPADEMNLVLSFLTFYEFQRLSILSKRLNEAVSSTSHLHMSSGIAHLSRLPRCMNKRRHPLSDLICSPSTVVSPSTQAQHHEDRATKPSRLNAFPLPQDDLRAFLGRFQQLNVLHLKGLGEVGDDVVSILNESPAASTITQISLDGCALSYWCNQALRLENLQHATITGGSIRARICSILQHSPHLQSLSIGQCPALRDDTVVDMVKLLHDKLKSLTLHQCIRVQNPVLQFPRLTHLSLVGCFGLTTMPGFTCPNLRVLDLSFCVRLPSQQIEQIVTHQLPHLEELIMVKCAAVQTLELSSLSIRQLNVSFCNLLGELRIFCPALRVFENASCSSLSTIVVKNAQSLEELNLSNASPLLQRLELQAPKLVRLNLEGCRRLNHCQIQCPNLEQVDVRGSRIVALRFCKDVRQVLVRRWSCSSNVADQSSSNRIVTTDPTKKVR